MIHNHNYKTVFSDGLIYYCSVDSHMEILMINLIDKLQIRHITGDIIPLCSQQSVVLLTLLKAFLYWSYKALNKCIIDISIYNDFIFQILNFWD